MKEGVEILCIGTELLLGNILNSNAQWIADQLAILGLPHYRQTVTGDNLEKLKTIILESSQRCKILITTGGLGPTPDDLTTQAIAEAFNHSLKEKKGIWEDINAKLNNNQNKASLNNRKQALFPESAEIIPNKIGTAPGMIWEPVKGFHILTFPGVPSELKDMWKETAKGWLKKNGGSNHTFASKVLKVSGISESVLAEKVGDQLNSKNPTIAPYANLGDVKLRITAKAKNPEEANSILLPTENLLREIIGTNCYGENNDTLASVVINLLIERNETISVAESCSGGKLCASLCSVPGASQVVMGGVIAYNNLIKEKTLDVPYKLIQRYGAVSENVAMAMASGVRKRMDTNWSISTTGIAGPSGGSEEKKIGLVYLAIENSEKCISIKKNFGESRRRVDIQKLSVVSGLDQLRLLLLSQS